MSNPLKKLTIKGFKSIKELEDFELKDLNVLIGGNGVGKSNFIQFFKLLHAMMKQDGLKEFVAGDADLYLFGGPKTTKQINVTMKFGLNGYAFELAPTEDGFFLINNEKRHYFPLDGATRSFGSGNLNPLLPTEINTSEATKYTYNAINSWQIYHFHDTTKNAGMRRYCNMEVNEKLLEDASNIAAFLKHLADNHKKEYDHIVNSVRLVTPFFDDFILKANGKERVRLLWRQKGLKDYPMRPSQLSDGTIRFICLATALLQPEPPSTIIIDEPELGLHPQALNVLAELIQAASERTQVIISTQSPSLIDNFAIDDIIVVRRKDGASIFERLNETDFNVWLEDYSVGELWSKNVIAGGPVHE